LFLSVNAIKTLVVVFLGRFAGLEPADYKLIDVCDGLEMFL
jgi:hypothetical protein